MKVRFISGIPGPIAILQRLIRFTLRGSMRSDFVFSDIRGPIAIFQRLRGSTVLGFGGPGPAFAGVSGARDSS